jgi:hypothetical protein
MTAHETWTDAEGPISMCTAPPGWRAIYIHENGDGGPGWSDDPVVAFGTYRLIERRIGTHTQVRDDGCFVEGIVWAGADGFVRAEEVSNFWRYLPPGAPDPTVGEVAAKQAAHRKPLGRPQALDLR